jgi:hypothetical protein
MLQLISPNLAASQFPILPWENGSTLRQAQRGASLTTGFFFVEPCVHAVFPGTARQPVLPSRTGVLAARTVDGQSRGQVW